MPKGLVRQVFAPPPRQRAGRLLALLLPMIASLLVAKASSAQAPPGPPPGWVIEPAFTVAGEYDSNVDGEGNSDYLGRFTGSLSLTYLSSQLSLAAGYSIDGEVYAERSDLDNVGDRQRGYLSGAYAVSPLTLVGVGVGFTLTRTSADFLQAPPPPAPELLLRSMTPFPGACPKGDAALLTRGVSLPGSTVVGVDTGRERAWALNASAFVDHRFSPTLCGTAAYSYLHSDVSDGPQVSGHIVDIAGGYDFTAIDQGTLRYVLSVFKDDDDTTTVFQSALVGWRHLFSPRLSTSLEVGPRFGEDTVNADARAAVYYALDRGGMGLTYTRSQDLVVGETSSSTVDTVRAFVSYLAMRDLSVGASASFSNVEEDPGADTRIFGVTATVSYVIAPWLTASLSYDFSREDGDSDTIDRHVVTLALTFGYSLYFR